MGNWGGEGRLYHRLTGIQVAETTNHLASTLRNKHWNTSPYQELKNRYIQLFYPLCMTEFPVKTTIAEAACTGRHERELRQVKREKGKETVFH